MPKHRHALSASQIRTLRRILIAVVAIALLGAAIFGMRLAHASRNWQDHPPEPIAGWMSPRYVSMSQHVPPEIIGQLLHLDPNAPHRKVSIADLAAEQNITTQAFITDLETAIADFKDHQSD